MVCGLGVPAIYPSSSTLTRSSPSLHRLRSGYVRRLQRYYEKTPTSPIPSVPFAGITYRCARASFAPLGTARRTAGLDLFLNGARTVQSTTENQRPPRFLGDPRVYHALLLDPAERLAPGLAARTLLPSTLKTVSASETYSFRGSITRPGDPLCTLRSQGHPCTTQHSVPAGCQPLPGRLTSCRVPSEVLSQIFLYMTYLSSKLSLAHSQPTWKGPRGAV